MQEAFAPNRWDFVPGPSLVSGLAISAGLEQELHARASDMDWDQPIAYTLTQTTRALTNSNPGPSHERAAASRCGG